MPADNATPEYEAHQPDASARAENEARALTHQPHPPGVGAASGIEAPSLTLRVGVIGILAVILAGAAAWLLLRTGGVSPAPPAVDLSRVPSEIAEHVAEARQRVVDEPSSAEAWGRLGMVFRAYDFETASNACFARAEELDPHDERWPYLRGVSLASADPAAALECYSRAARIDPEFLHARFRLAELLMTLDRVREAEIHVRAAQHIAPDHPRTHLLLARLAWFRGDVRACLEWATKSADGAPGQRETHELLARAYHASGNRKAAGEQLEILAKLPPGRTNWDDPLVAEVVQLRRDAGWLAIRAQELLQHSQHREAISILEQLVARQPESAEFHYELGLALVTAGADQRAADVLDRALERRIASSEILRLRGVLHYTAGEWQPSAERFRESIERKPDSAVAHYNLGHSLLKLGEPEAALAAFGAAARLQPDYADAHTNIGRLLLESGQRAQAVEHLRLASEFAPHDATPARLLKEATAGER